MQLQLFVVYLLLTQLNLIKHVFTNNNKAAHLTDEYVAIIEGGIDVAQQFGRSHGLEYLGQVSLI